MNASRPWGQRLSSVFALTFVSGPAIKAILRYGAAIAGVPAAIKVASLTGGGASFGVLSVFLIAVALAGWFLGLGPSLLSALLSALALDYFFIEPVGHLSPVGVAADAMPLLILLASVLAVSSVHRRLQAAVSEATLGQAQAKALSQELQRAMEARASLEAGIAHDLRHPIGIIQIHHALLRDAKTGPEAAVHLQGIEFAASELSRLAAQLMDLSRLEYGQPPPLDLRATNLAELIQRVVTERQAGMERRFQLRMLGGRLVGEWDADRLERVFHNLLDNAAKYSTGDIVVQVWREEDASGAQAVVEVTDQGMGIPMGDLPHIFDGFYRGANVGRMAGMGVGLMTSKQIIEQHRGRIDVSTEVGKGTTFTVHLPLEADTPGPAEAESRGPAA